MRKNEKNFDCVELMHEGALRIHAAMKNKTQVQRLAYWKQKESDARRKYPNMREASR